MYTANTMLALREFFLMHTCTTDPNLADVDEIFRAHGKVKKFMAGWLSLKNALEDKSKNDIRTICFDAGKFGYGDSRDHLREWFSDMNLILFNKKDGPQLSEFIRIYGTENFLNRVDLRLKNYMSLFLL